MKALIVAAAILAAGLVNIGEASAESNHRHASWSAWHAPQHSVRKWHAPKHSARTWRAPQHGVRAWRAPNYHGRVMAAKRSHHYQAKARHGGRAVRHFSRGGNDYHVVKRARGNQENGRAVRNVYRNGDLKKSTSRVWRDGDLQRSVKRTYRDGESTTVVRERNDGDGGAQWAGRSHGDR